MNTGVKSAAARVPLRRMTALNNSIDGRYRTRTCDLFRVHADCDVRSHNGTAVQQLAYRIFKSF
jgi:hypothetical protein